MRLIHLRTLQLHEFHGSEIPPYAILSHRWGSRELSYEEAKRGFRHMKLKQFTRRGPAGMLNEDDVVSGYRKLKSFCDNAREWPVRIWNEEEMEIRKGQVEWGWVDTCCIDVKSSAELSEAIQSFYPWYQYSSVCFVYLADVRKGGKTLLEALKGSEWFERGWTLQELLAPWDVIFFNRDWEVLGHKCSLQHELDKCSSDADLRSAFGPSLNKELSAITGISEDYLRNPGSMHNASIACRMSWAWRRTTTRVEDIAYCLLGIFNVSMPLLYGEGRKAFQRLQEHIVQVSNDQSIFARNQTTIGTGDSMFASHPSDFSEGQHIHSLAGVPDTTYTLTNNGLEMQGDVQEVIVVEHRTSDPVYILTLNCCFLNDMLADEYHYEPYGDAFPIEIAVSTTTMTPSNECIRLCCDTVSNRLVQKRYPKCHRGENKSRQLHLKARETYLGHLRLRTLCHELATLPPVDDNVRTPPRAVQNFLDELDWNKVKHSSLWKHIQPTYEAVEAHRAATAGLSTTLEKARELAKAALQPRPPRT